MGYRDENLDTEAATVHHRQERANGRLTFSPHRRIDRAGCQWGAAPRVIEPCAYRAEVPTLRT